MRYLLISFLLFSPIVSYAQYSDDSQVTQLSSAGTSGGGAYTKERRYKSRYLTKHNIKRLEPLPEFKAQPSTQPRTQVKPIKPVMTVRPAKPVAEDFSDQEFSSSSAPLSHPEPESSEKKDWGKAFLSWLWPDKSGSGEPEKSAAGVKGVLKDEAKQYHQEGYKLQSNGDYKGALPYYQKAAQLDPYSPAVLNDLGVCYEAVGEDINAVNMYRKSIELDPEYLAAYTNLALFYEDRGDARNASYYWQKRYEKGQAGEYWREQAAQHLMRLGTYPEVKRDILEKEAAKLSRELATQRESKKRLDIEDARLHYYIGQRLVMKGDLAAALKEFETALVLNPAEVDLRDKIIEAYKNAQRSYAKEKVLSDTQDALNYVKSEDFISAESKLRSALSAAYTAAQEK
jgi:Flp pilus assembly protein TadD